MTAEQRKEQALQQLKELNIYKPYIDGFEKKDRVCFFERFGGYWVYQEPEIEAKMKEIEKRYNCTVYAITHECLIFGECFTFLIVTNYKEEWKRNFKKNRDKTFTAFAYVWNKDADFCSEFGSVGIQSAFGGLRRIS